MKRSLYALALLALCPAIVSARSKPQYDVAPPGRVVQDTVAYLTGEGMNSAWHVVASREIVGKHAGKEPAYQWYLSFYAPAQNGLKLVHQLPNAGGELLSRVTKAHGADLYFPQQDVKIVGAAELQQPGVQNVVVWDHQSGADCGTADVTVFGADSSGRVVESVHVENGCSLSAQIVKHGALAAVQLNGPYYGPKAPMCCPTKPKARALLSYSGGAWRVTPNYYIISASLAAHR